MPAPHEFSGLNLFRHWKAFKSELAEAAKMDSQTEQLRMTYVQSLALEFLQQDPELVASGTLKPLWAIYVALHDLSLGGRPAVLFGAERPDDVVTKSKITFTHYAQGQLAAAYAAL